MFEALMLNNGNREGAFENEENQDQENDDQGFWDESDENPNSEDDGWEPDVDDYDDDVGHDDEETASTPIHAPHSSIIPDPFIELEDDVQRNRTIQMLSYDLDLGIFIDETVSEEVSSNQDDTDHEDHEDEGLSVSQGDSDSEAELDGTTVF